ncbi:MAG: copper amine oxidase N-terminal domain-containing protein, partial [Firmicutes bacterium]|nr:copper amine oxidase N-terminal domain-containing protein [Bacillota bacterium]
MVDNKKLRALLACFFGVLLLALFISRPAVAAGEVAEYVAPDGFRVISYSPAWSDTNQLKGVYDELRRNAHGEEFKLLNKINIYPGLDPVGQGAAGRWYGVWKMEDGKPRLAGNRYIDIYNGEEYTTINSIARTLAHEYGHHFTYYYYYIKENKLWENWRSTGLAEARQLKNNPKVGAATRDHKWLIQEIAAEDYVQFFGSASIKKSVDFSDISERLAQNKPDVSFTTDMYNYHPQENFEIPLASNLPGLKNYWLKVSGLKVKTSNPPSQIRLKLKEVNQLPGVKTPQYVFSWDRSIDDNTRDLEYTLVRFEAADSAAFYPVKTVAANEPLEAVTGSASNSNMYIWEDIPNGSAYYVVYVQDGDGLVTSSQVLAVDFGVPLSPQSVLIDDASRSRGIWFPPRVKVNSRQMDFEVPPYIQKDSTLVPLKDIFKELGATVEWEAKSQAIKAVKGNTTVTLQ